MGKHINLFKVHPPPQFLGGADIALPQTYMSIGDPLALKQKEVRKKEAIARSINSLREKKEYPSNQSPFTDPTCGTTKTLELLQMDVLDHFKCIDFQHRYT